MSITVTIGPSSIKKDVLINLKKAGAKRFRINLSHSNKDSLVDYFNIIQSCGISPSIDTQGAQIRIKEFSLINSYLREGQLLDIIFENFEFKCFSEEYIKLSCKEAFYQISKDDILKLDFNGLAIRILSSEKNFHFKGKVISEGKVLLNKAVDVSGKSLSLPILTDFDEYAIDYALNRGTKTVFASFVSNLEQAKIVKDKIGKDCILVSKIETSLGVKNINDITNFSDEILIDRGDLSRETSITGIPIVTSRIIKKANQNNCPVHVATNILDSMMNNPIPSRAEVSDIFNLLKDNVAGLVLAAEVAIGNNPVSSTALLSYLFCVYKKYNEKSFDLIEKDKPSISLLGKELFNWI